MITIALWTAATEPGAAPIPGFVIAIFVSLFISFNVFAFNMVLQYRKTGRWADYLYGERVVHVPQPVREDDPRLAGLRRDPPAVA